MNAITGLRADIVPHRRWPISKWYYANPLWYYHRLGTDEQIVANRKFYELVDPELREVCKLLNAAGLHTTPSCEGHFYPRERFEKIWDELSGESQAVRNGGLVVKDSGTDEPFLFRDPDYTMPWPTFDAFFEEAARHQGTGYLGFVVPPQREDLLEAFGAISCESGTNCLKFEKQLSDWFDGWLFDITVQPGDAEQRRQSWADLTEQVRRVLNR